MQCTRGRDDEQVLVSYSERCRLIAGTEVFVNIFINALRRWELVLEARCEEDSDMTADVEDLQW